MSEIEIPKPVFLDRLGGDEIYGFGQDGDVTLTANTTLSRDMYYDDLTINSGVTLDTNGYRVFVRGTLAFADSTSRIGRFSNKTTTGTLKGGFAKGVAATDTLGGASGEQSGTHPSGNEFFSGENEMFNLSVAIAGHAIDVDTGNYKFIGGGSGGGDGSTNAASAGADGSDSNWSDYQVVGADGGKGSPGNAATAGTGAVGGGVVIVLAKTVTGDGTVRADGDEPTSGTDGTTGAPAPDASTPGNVNPGNVNTHPGNNYSYGYSYGYSYSGNNYSYPGNTNTHPGNNYSYSGSNPHTHYHWHPVYLNSYSTGSYHYHYNHWHPYTNYGSNPTNYGSNPTNYGSNPTNYGANYGANYGSNPTNYSTNPDTTNPTTYHPGGAGGAGGTATDGYNAGGGTVVFVTGTKPLPSGLTLAAAAGTSGTGTAGAGTVVTVFNIDADDTDPGA
jgi:hypothetical protein